jgi:hypothetical protein
MLSYIKNLVFEKKGANQNIVSNKFCILIGQSWSRSMKILLGSFMTVTADNCKLMVQPFGLVVSEFFFNFSQSETIIAMLFARSKF